MNNQKSCICNGMNEECSKCGGSGFIPDTEITIIKTNVDPRIIQRQKEELDKYQHGDEEKMYLSNKAGSIKRKKKPNKTLVELNEKNYLQFVGPDNPNRQKLGDTRRFGIKKNKADVKKKNVKKKKG
jgi:hypothetical protein